MDKRRIFFLPSFRYKIKVFFSEPQFFWNFYPKKWSEKSAKFRKNSKIWFLFSQLARLWKVYINYSQHIYTCMTNICFCIWFFFKKKREVTAFVNGKQHRSRPEELHICKHSGCTKLWSVFFCLFPWNSVFILKFCFSPELLLKDLNKGLWSRIKTLLFQIKTPFDTPHKQNVYISTSHQLDCHCRNK